MTPEDTFFPGLRVHHLTSVITWQFYKHWGQGVYAGEGLRDYHGDRSGCVHDIGPISYTNIPTVVQARLYEGPRGQISAVYSYPRGLGLVDHYFWEIYPVGGDVNTADKDVERYDTEIEMELRIEEMLA